MNNFPERFDMKRFATYLILSLFASGVACTDAPIPLSESQTTLDLEFAESENAGGVVDDIIGDISDADRRIDAALSHLKNEEIANALVDAQNRGVEVRVVSDVDHRDEAGFQILDDGGIVPVFGDGQVSYLPNPNLSPALGVCQNAPQREYKRCVARDGGGGVGTMIRPGSYNLMSHNFILIDTQTVWNIAKPFNDVSGPQIGWKAKSELLRRDLGREFQQLHGGVFSVDLSTFGGESKAKVSSSAVHHSNHGDIIIRQNPQERLIKTVIDRIYEAKSSVFIASDSIRNPFVLDALEYKADNGFEVRILVNDDQQPQGDPRERLDAMGAEFVTSPDAIPTVVLTNAVSKPDSDEIYPRTAQILSHPIWRGRPFEVNVATPSDEVFIYPSDQFIDGNLWELREKSGNVHLDDELDRIEDFWDQMWDDATS
jgi:hypothetical protein